MHGLNRSLLLGVALGVVESTILPSSWPLRIGLANIATLYAATGGVRPAVTVAALRSVLVAMATGTLLAPSGLFSIAGGVASAILMALILRAPVSLVFASAVGGVASSLVQVAVFAAFSGVSVAAMMPFTPWFATWGALTGAGTGLVASRLVTRAAVASSRTPSRSSGEMVQNQFLFEFDTPRRG